MHQSFTVSCANPCVRGEEGRARDCCAEERVARCERYSRSRIGKDVVLGLKKERKHGKKEGC
jgi:hypothetical protein